MNKSVLTTSFITAAFVVGIVYVWWHLKPTSHPGYANKAPEGEKVRTALAGIPGTLPPFN